jgi:DNA-binding CsgD family transcriptional regulator
MTLSYTLNTPTATPEPSPRADLLGKPLTARETEVLWLLTEGLSNKEIAARLNLDTNTIKSHLRNAGRKIGAVTRTKAAIDFALGQGNAAIVRIVPSSTTSEFATIRNKLLESNKLRGALREASRDTWLRGFATALAQIHRQGGESSVVRVTARTVGLSLAAASLTGVSPFDLEELKKAGIP